MAPVIDTTSAHPPNMVDASKLVDLVHEIAEQNNILSRYYEDAQKLKLTIRSLVPKLRNRMDEFKDLGPNADAWKKQLTEANSKLDEHLLERRKALTRLGDLKHELLELVPYWNDVAIDMILRNLPSCRSSSGSNQLIRSPKSKRTLIASKDRKNSSCATEVVDSIAVLNSPNRDTKSVGTTSVRMVEASKVLDVVHDIAYQVTLLYANETESYEALSNFWNIMHEIQRLNEPGLATELIGETTKLYRVHYKIDTSSPRLWGLTHELLDLVPDSNDKTLEEVIRSISTWKNSRNCRPFDPLRVIKSRDLMKDIPELKFGGDIAHRMFDLHCKNFKDRLFLRPMWDKLVEIYKPVSEKYIEEYAVAGVLGTSKWRKIMSRHRNPWMDKAIPNFTEVMNQRSFHLLSDAANR